MIKLVLRSIGFVGLSLLVSAPSAKAGYTTTLSGAQPGQTYFDGDISASDLVNVGSMMLGSFTQTPGAAAGTPDGAHDGSAASLSPNDDFFQSETTLTFNLNLNPGSGGSATGYTLSKIQSIAGWGSAGYGAQSFSLYVTTLANPTFTAIGSVFDNESGIVDDFSGNTPQATETLLNGDAAGIATGVTALEFVYHVPASGGTVLREIDVFGTPTFTVVPEPSTWWMIFGGLGTLFAARRIRRRPAAPVI